MDVGDVGYGAGGGLLSAVLTYFGFKQRQDRTDQDLATLKQNVVYKDTCAVCHQSTNRAMDEVNRKLDVIITALQRRPE